MFRERRNINSNNKCLPSGTEESNNFNVLTDDQVKNYYNDEDCFSSFNPTNYLDADKNIDNNIKNPNFINTYNYVPMLNADDQHINSKEINNYQPSQLSTISLFDDHTHDHDCHNSVNSFNLNNLNNCYFNQYDNKSDKIFLPHIPQMSLFNDINMDKKSDYDLSSYSNCFLNERNTDNMKSCINNTSLLNSPSKLIFELS